MSTLYGMNTDTTVSAKKGTNAWLEEHFGTFTVYIVEGERYKARVGYVKTYKAVASPEVDTDWLKVGSFYHWVTDTGLGHRNGGKVRLVGRFDSTGASEGDLPEKATKSLPLYVFK